MAPEPRWEQPVGFFLKCCGRSAEIFEVKGGKAATIYGKITGAQSSSEDGIWESLYPDRHMAVLKPVLEGDINA